MTKIKTKFKILIKKDQIIISREEREKEIKKKLKSTFSDKLATKHYAATSKGRRGGNVSNDKIQ